MNILWLSHFVPYPPVAGQVLRSYNLIRELARDHRVHLLAANQRALHSTRAAVESAVRELSRVCASVEVCDVPCERSRAAYYGLLLSNLARTIPYSVQRIRPTDLGPGIDRVLQQHPIDLVHFDTIELATFTDRTAGLPRTMTHHNIESTLLVRRAAMSSNPLSRAYLRLQARKVRAYETRHLPGFDCNLTVSELDREQLEACVPGLRVQAIPNGSDIEYFQPDDSAGQGLGLIFVGNMGWFPNHDAATYFVRRVWPLVRSEEDRATLQLVGPGERSIGSLKEAPGVTVTGLVDDIRPYLHRAAVVVVPIRGGGGTRLKILDALACGKAVVTTRIGCEGIDAEHERHLLFADTPEEFSREVVRLLRDPALRLTLGREGRALVERNYSWRSIGRTMSSLYSSLLHD